MYDKIIVSNYNDKTHKFSFPKIERRIHQMKDETVEGYPLVTTTGLAYIYGKTIPVFYDDGEWVTKNVLKRRQTARNREANE